MSEKMNDFVVIDHFSADIFLMVCGFVRQTILKLLSTAQDE